MNTKHLISILLFFAIIILGCQFTQLPVSSPATPTIIPNQSIHFNDFFGGNLFYQNYPFTLKIPEGFVSVGGTNNAVTWLSDPDAKNLANNQQIPQNGNFFITGDSSDTIFDKETDTFINLPNQESEIPDFEANSGMDVISIEKTIIKGHPLLFIKAIPSPDLGVNSPFIYLTYIATPQTTDAVIYIIYFSSTDEQTGNDVWNLFRTSFEQ